MKISAKTDIGQVRETNQDSYETGALPDGGAWAVVCDGMGGHAGGNVASGMAASSIAGHIKENYREGMGVSSVKYMLESAISTANAKILDKSLSDRELYGMGTTVVAVVASGNECVTAHVGDSRCYHISGGEINLVTKDHSLVQELLDSGVITEEEAEHHPRKNIITRALGISEEVAADFSFLTLKKDDILLLCTDGLSNCVSKEEILKCLSDAKDFNYSDILVETANENGGYDNITAVALVAN